MTILVHAIVVAVATLGLMVMGNLVHATGSSLACPDWPLCHGSPFPAMVNGVEFEHTHRLMAAAVATLVASLYLRLRRRGLTEARLAALACGLIGAQAILGALTVLLRLPPGISIAHLGTSMAVFFTVVLLAVRLFPESGQRPGVASAALWPVTALVFCQIVLGGAVRHSGSALACDGLPLCGGVAWPSHWLGRIHMAHRVLGVAALVGCMGLSIATCKRDLSTPWRALALSPAIVASAQVGLGAAVVLGHASLDAVTLHHLFGAALLASLAACRGATNGKPLPDPRNPSIPTLATSTPSLDPGSLVARSPQVH